MAKFKVGDKVRVVKTEHTSVWYRYNVGDIFEVESVSSGVLDTVSSGVLDTVDGPRLWFKEVEKVSDKPTKNQRITTLEQTVAELQAEVAALKSAQVKADTTPKFVPVTTDNIAVGDSIRVIDADEICGGCDLSNGKIYEVADVEDGGDFYFTDDAGDHLVINPDEFHAIEKVVSE